ncbi:uncharacterized protein [Dermacentor andersoni]|uniref:uncharacterized protein n=1 Tax=Dermacentor andersoni TaxID=34620 RepID=UPI003B3AC824
MFYVHEILHRRKGKFGLLWLAATSPKSVRHVKLLNISLAKLSEDLQRELTKGIFGNKSLRFSLRLSCQLIMGLWVLYRRKAALVRAEAEECLQMLTRRRQFRTTSIDLPKAKRRKGVTVTADVPHDFGKVSHPIAAPEDLTADLPAGDEAAGALGLTVDVDTITLREEVPMTQDDALERDAIPVEVEDGGDILDELDKLMALHKGEQAPGAGSTAASPQATVEEPARPISPIPRVESRTPPLPRTHRASSRSPRTGEPAVSEPVEAVRAGPTEPPTGAEPELRAAEDELEEAMPVVPEAELSADASAPLVQPDVDAAAQPERAPSPAAPPAPRPRRRRIPGSPPSGEPVRRRRRRSRVIIDQETEIDMETLRQNIRDSSAAALTRDIAVLPTAQDAETLFRQPGRRLLSKRLLVPWQRVRTLPRPDDEEPAVAPEEPVPEPEPEAEPVPELVPEPVPEPLLEPVAELASEQTVEAQELPSAHGLEVAREPSLQDTSTASGEGKLAGRTSVVPSMTGIPEEEQQVEVPGAEEDQLPIPEGPAPPEDEPEQAPVAQVAPPDETVVHAVPAADAPVAQQGSMLRVWDRLQQFSDDHGLCTMETLVTPDAFNRRAVASCFGALLRLHKRQLVHLSQDQPYGPIVIEVNQQEQGTPPMAGHLSP